jgi:hypothetical protein
MTTPPEQHGVCFPEVDGRRSTSAVGRAVVADALREVDPVGAASAEREPDWRQGYVGHFRRLVEAGLASPEAARAVARDGLAALHRRLHLAGPDGEERPLAEAVDTLVCPDRGADRPLTTTTVEGAASPETELSVPYRGKRLRGDALLRQVDTWVDAGVAEPSLAEAVADVVDHPEWLAVPGRTVVVLGAAAEMGPLRSLLRWGADVAAVDLPRPDLWERLLPDARGRAGRVHVPVAPGDGDVAARAGVDLIGDLSRAATWVADLPGPMVVGNYVYADGATNVRVSAAVDALTEAVRRTRAPEDVALAFLATPTDVFAVPGDAVTASVAAYEHARTRLLRGPLRALSGGRLLRRNYRPGEDPGLNDSVVPQQGPNYLLAKRVHRWRAAAARADGVPVSSLVAPPTRTRSVVKNRALAAAYAGAHRFGIEVFDPGTSNTLMAALLVRDLHTDPPPAAEPVWRSEARAAVHGGLWRAAYAPRSALGLAAVLGAASPR